MLLECLKKFILTVNKMYQFEQTKTTFIFATSNKMTKTGEIPILGKLEDEWY